MNFYVYGLLDPRKPGKFEYEGLDICFLYEPFYIGYGQKNRLCAHFYPSSLKIKSRKSNKIKSIINKGLDVIKIKIHDNLSFDDANKIEIEIINCIGKKILTNISDGGRGCTGTKILKTRKSVDKVCLKTLNVLESYVSITEASAKNNTNISNISSCIRGFANTHNGFGWKYTSDDALSKVETNIKVRVDVYDKEKGFLQTCNSISEAVKITGISSQYITRCCQMKIKFKGNYYFEYTDRKEKYDYLNRKREIYTVPVKLIDENGKEIKFEYLKDCAEYLNISVSYVIGICKGNTGKRLKYDIFYLNDRRYDEIKKEFKYRENIKKIPIKQLDLDGNLIKIWNGLSDIKTLNYSASLVSQVCRGNYKSAYGFKWEYLNNKNNI